MLREAEAVLREAASAREQDLRRQLADLDAHARVRVCVCVCVCVWPCDSACATPIVTRARGYEVLFVFPGPPCSEQLSSCESTQNHRQIPRLRGVFGDSIRRF